MSGSVKCNRCGQDGLGWCVSRASGKHYLAYLVPQQIVRDGVIVNELRPQANLLHKCGKSIEDARISAAEFAAERARIRALGQSPQPIAPTATAAPVAAKPSKRTKTPVKPVPVSTAAVGAVSVVDKSGTALPFKTDGGPVKMTAVTGKVEAAVTAAQAIVPVLVSKGLPESAARAMVAAMGPAELAGLLLKL